MTPGATDRLLSMDDERSIEVGSQASAAQFEAIVEVMSEGVVAFGADQRIIICNPAAQALLKLDASGLLGRRFEDLPELVDAGEPGWFEETFDGGAVSRQFGGGPLELVDREGVTRFVEPTVSTVRVDGGSVTALIMRDRTDSEWASRQLRSALEFDRLVLNTIDALVLVLDDRGRIVSLNSAAERTTGHNAFDVTGRSFFDLLIPAHRRIESHQNFDQLLARGGSTTSETDWVTADRSHRLVRWTASVLSDDSAPDTDAEVVVTGLDVTHQRQLESQVIEAERVRAAAQLAGGLAHDFNNICAIIKGHLDLLAGSEPADDDSRRRFRAIDVAIERLQGLTSNLANLDQQQAAETRAVSLNEVVARLGSVLTDLMDPGITLEIRAGAEADAVRADRARLEQLIFNLVFNASDACEQAGTIAVTTEHLDRRERSGSDHPWVCLRVVDDGHGMDPDVRERIFEPFFTTKARGSGLGLPLVRAIAEAHGGVIEVDSAPGEGTTVSVWLPLREDADGPSDAADPTDTGRPCDAVEPGDVAGPVVTSPARSGCEPSRTVVSVLLVEDEDEARQVFSDMLTIHGYRVDAASSVREALEVIARGGPPDALITDLRMPGGGGDELVAALRRDHPSLPVLFISAYQQHQLPVAAHGERQAFLRKPFSSDDLLVALATLVGGRPGAR